MNPTTHPSPASFLDPNHRANGPDPGDAGHSGSGEVGRNGGSGGGGPAGSARGRYAGRRVDSFIIMLAAAQHGIVTRGQLLHAGVPRHVIDRLLRWGLLRRVHAGVYQVGPVVAPLANEMAALLACGGGTLSHWSAATLWKVSQPRRSGESADVTLPAGLQRGRRPGIRTHRSNLALDEITQVDGVHVTTPARTLVDLGTVATPRELERMVAIAERTDLCTRDDLLTLLRRHARRRGTRRLLTMLGNHARPALTRSEAEERILALVRAGGIRDPEMNVVIHDHEVDCYWRHARLVVEVDGYAYHASERAFVRDRQRDSALAAAGIQVLRLSWHQISRERDKTLVQLAQALARAEA
jgi:very-short-patch-repair endonuclease